MELYGILRHNGWSSEAELQAAAALSAEVGDEMDDRLRWVRSYVISEPSGSLGTFCIYEAASPDAIREHASRAGLPVDEIVKIADTVIVRADPAVAAG